MTLLECANCYRTVFVNKDGACPNCKNDARRPLTSDAANKTLITLSHRESLPDICCRCLSPTRRRTVLRHSHGGTSFDPSWQILISPFIETLTALANYQPGDEVWVRIPLCRFCKSHDPLVPAGVSLARMTIRVVVDKRFAAAVREFRAEAEG